MLSPDLEDESREEHCLQVGSQQRWPKTVEGENGCGRSSSSSSSLSLVVVIENRQIVVCIEASEGCYNSLSFVAGMIDRWIVFFELHPHEPSVLLLEPALLGKMYQESQEKLESIKESRRKLLIHRDRKYFVA